MKKDYKVTQLILSLGLAIFVSQELIANDVEILKGRLGDLKTSLEKVQKTLGGLSTNLNTLKTNLTLLAQQDVIVEKPQLKELNFTDYSMKKEAILKEVKKDVTNSLVTLIGINLQGRGDLQGQDIQEIIDSCKSKLATLNLDGCIGLKTLDLSDCPQLTLSAAQTLPESLKLLNLNNLKIDDKVVKKICSLKNIEIIHALGSEKNFLKNLKKEAQYGFLIFENSEIRIIQDLNQSDFTKIAQSDKGKLVGISLKIVENGVVDLKEFTKLKDVTFAVAWLKELDLQNCIELESFDVTECTNLNRLNLNNCSKLRSVQLNKSGKLEELYFEEALELSFGDDFLKQCENLKKFNISSSSKLLALPITNWKDLQELKINNCPQLAELHLTNLGNLDSFNFDGSTSLQKIYLSNCPKINKLSLGDYKNLENVQLKNCTVLADLNFKNCTSLKQITLVQLNNLQNLNLDGCAWPLNIATLPQSLKILGLENRVIYNLPNDIAKICTSFKELEEIRLTGCNIEKQELFSVAQTLPQMWANLKQTAQDLFLRTWINEKEWNCEEENGYVTVLKRNSVNTNASLDPLTINLVQAPQSSIKNDNAAVKNLSIFTIKTPKDLEHELDKYSNKMISLNLANTTLKEIPAFEKYTNIVNLDLSNCVALNNLKRPTNYLSLSPSLHPIVDHLPSKLEILKLNEWGSIKNHDIVAICSKLTRLKEIQLKEKCYSINQSSLELELNKSGFPKKWEFKDNTLIRI